MAKFPVYKYVRVSGRWRYARAANSPNNKLKPNVVVLPGGCEEAHSEGAYYVYAHGAWVRAGLTAADAYKAQQRLLGRQMCERAGEKLPEEKPQAGTPLAVAVEKYFTALEAQGKDPKTIRAYRAAVGPFIAQCSKPYVELVDKDDVMGYMAWLRRQPVPVRKHGNPERTYFNKVSHVAIFLRHFGVSKLLKKWEYPQYTEKAVVAHTDDELAQLYFRADAEQKFLLDFALGTGFREGEIAHAEYEDLKGNVIRVQRKPHFNWHPKKQHCRPVTIPQSLADAIRARGNAGLIFPNALGRPDGHLLRRLQRLAKSCSIFSELHRLRKTWASRLALSGMPLHRLQVMLGHKSLVTTQHYLADIELSKGETGRLVEAAAYVPTDAMAMHATA